MSSLTGKVALVTGAGRGIGRAIAMELARAGASVCINDIDGEAAEESQKACGAYQSDTCVAVYDVSSPAGAAQAVELCVRVLGGLDILVNNAGVLGRYCLLENFTEADIDAIFGVNVRGCLNMVRAAVPVMKGKGWGRILNAASMYGIEPQVGRGIYSASKAAVIALTRVLAAELAPYGITVNAYAPGTIATAMSRESLQSRAEEKVRQVPLRRAGVPEDVAGLVAFLASDRASYVTGAVVPIDGGALSVQSPWRAWEAVSGVGNSCCGQWAGQEDR